MNVNLIIVKNELENLLNDVKNDNYLLEKSELTNRLENIIHLINTNSKYEKPKPMISQPNKYDYNSITKTEFESKKLGNFLNEKKIFHEKLILTHENNLDNLPLDNNINVNLIEYDNNDNKFKNNNESEEIYWSPILQDSTYIQMKKFN